jgi:hypothetical protein
VQDAALGSAPGHRAARRAFLASGTLPGPRRVRDDG